MKKQKNVAFTVRRKCPSISPSLTYSQRCLATKELPICAVICIFSYIIDRRDHKAPRCHRGFKSVRIKSYMINTSP